MVVVVVKMVGFTGYEWGSIYSLSIFFLENYCGGDLYSLFIRNDSSDEISSKIF